MEVFVAAYANSRFCDDWQLSAELSLLKHGGHTSIAKQLLLQSPKANNQTQGLPHGCSLFLYRVSESQLVALRAPDASGLLLIPLPDALIRISPTFFAQHEMAAQIAMRQVDISLLIARLLEGGHSLVAGRLAGALKAVGGTADANQLLTIMKAAMYTTTENNQNNPFARPLAQINGRRNESPYVLRTKAMWSTHARDCRQAVRERSEAGCTRCKQPAPGHRRPVRRGRIPFAVHRRLPGQRGAHEKGPQ
jgi:hypothetical protein